MNIELLFYTQLGSILGFIIVIFTLYRLLVSQKDGVIEILKQKNEWLEKKIKELDTQSPDVLFDSLLKRVEFAKTEIDLLHKDGEGYKGEILDKEAKVDKLRIKLEKLKKDIYKDREEYKDVIRAKEVEVGELSTKLEDLNPILTNYALICPECQSPLSERFTHLYDSGPSLEYFKYKCGYLTQMDKRGDLISPPISTCKSSL